MSTLLTKTMTTLVDTLLSHESTLYTSALSSSGMPARALPAANSATLASPTVPTRAARRRKLSRRMPKRQGHYCVQVRAPAHSERASRRAGLAKREEYGATWTNADAPPVSRCRSLAEAVVSMLLSPARAAPSLHWIAQTISCSCDHARALLDTAWAPAPRPCQARAYALLASTCSAADCSSQQGSAQRKAWRASASTAALSFDSVQNFAQCVPPTAPWACIHPCVHHPKRP